MLLIQEYNTIPKCNVHKPIHIRMERSELVFVVEDKRIHQDIQNKNILRSDKDERNSASWKDILE
jgi:hypothetical protein